MASNRAKLAVGIVAGGLLAVLLIGLWRELDRSRFSEAAADTDPPARRLARGEILPLLVNARQRPVSLEPVPGLADAVTEEQLLKALVASLPMWDPPAVPALIHQLRLWGQKAHFTRAMVGAEWSGTMMAQTLLSDKLCRERTSPHGASFLLDSPFGINVVLAGSYDAEENRAEGHFGQLVMVLGEAGVPLDAPVTTVSGRCGTVADLLQDMTMRFGWTSELPFAACALALWLPPETTWIDQFGNRYSFDELVERLMAIRRGEGPCGGCHVPYAVVTILGVDRQYPVLSASVRQRSLEWLGELSAHLEETQCPEGGWDGAWARGERVRLIYGDKVLDRLTVTGHHLEWIALAPASVRPSKPTVSRAVAAFVHDVDALPPISVRPFKSILPCSHGARAMCLLQGKDPYVTWKESWDRGRFVRGPRGLEVRRPDDQRPSVRADSPGAWGEHPPP